MKGERQAAEVDLQVDFRREAAARVAERLIGLPPFSLAAETWASTTVESKLLLPPRQNRGKLLWLLAD